MGTLARILIIEDNKNIAFTEQICLEAANYEVAVAEDGITGLELTLTFHPDLILLDLLIPKMNGDLFLEAQQNNPAISQIPVLVTSAKAQEAELKQAFLHRIRGYLIKPFEPEALLQKIERILNPERNDKSNESQNLGYR